VIEWLWWAPVAFIQAKPKHQGKPGLEWQALSKGWFELRNLALPQFLPCIIGAIHNFM